MVSSDGGKGSGRRKENAQAVRDNWDRIFGGNKMNEHDEDDPQERSDEDYERSEDELDERDHEDSEWTCDRCGGLMYRMLMRGYAKCDDCGARQELINDDYT